MFVPLKDKQKEVKYCALKTFSEQVRLCNPTISASEWDLNLFKTKPCSALKSPLQHPWQTASHPEGLHSFVRRTHLLRQPVLLLESRQSPHWFLTGEKNRTKEQLLPKTIRHVKVPHRSRNASLTAVSLGPRTVPALEALGVKRMTY